MVAEFLIAVACTVPPVLTREELCKEVAEVIYESDLISDQEKADIVRRCYNLNK